MQGGGGYGAGTCAPRSRRSIGSLGFRWCVSIAICGERTGAVGGGCCAGTRARRPALDIGHFGFRWCLRRCPHGASVRNRVRHCGERGAQTHIGNLCCRCCVSARLLPNPLCGAPATNRRAPSKARPSQAATCAHASIDARGRSRGARCARHSLEKSVGSEVKFSRNRPKRRIVTVYAHCADSGGGSCACAPWRQRCARESQVWSRDRMLWSFRVMWGCACAPRTRGQPAPERNRPSSIRLAPVISKQRPYP